MIFFWKIKLQLHFDEFAKVIFNGVKKHVFARNQWIEAEKEYVERTVCSSVVKHTAFPQCSNTKQTIQMKKSPYWITVNYTHYKMAYFRDVLRGKTVSHLSSFSERGSERVNLFRWTYKHKKPASLLCHFEIVPFFPCFNELNTLNLFVNYAVLLHIGAFGAAL